MTVLSFMKPYQKAAKDEATKDLAVEEEYKKDEEQQNEDWED